MSKSEVSCKCCGRIIHTDYPSYGLICPSCQAREIAIKQDVKIKVDAFSEKIIDNNYSLTYKDQLVTSLLDVLDGMTEKDVEVFYHLIEGIKERF